MTVISVLFSVAGVWLPLLQHTNISPGRTKEAQKASAAVEETDKSELGENFNILLEYTSEISFAAK